MAKDYEASSDEIKHVLLKGAKQAQPDGSTVHYGRHPASQDHSIKVVTRGNKVMSARVEYRPLQAVISEGKKREADAKARADRSKANKAAQLAKKRARTPKPKNK
jgi:hypothetical protein